MAIGLGKILGFTFHGRTSVLPYTAKSTTEFWRRWHISLLSCLPGLCLHTARRQPQACLSEPLHRLGAHGLWHGASWNFVLWGLYFFVLLCIRAAAQKWAFQNSKAGAPSCDIGSDSFQLEHFLSHGSDAAAGKLPDSVRAFLAPASQTRRPICCCAIICRCCWSARSAARQFRSSREM